MYWRASAFISDSLMGREAEDGRVGLVHQTEDWDNVGLELLLVRELDDAEFLISQHALQKLFVQRREPLPDRNLI